MYKENTNTDEDFRVVYPVHQWRVRLVVLATRPRVSRRRWSSLSRVLPQTGDDVAFCEAVCVLLYTNTTNLSLFWKDVLRVYTYRRPTTTTRTITIHVFGCVAKLWTYSASE